MGAKSQRFSLCWCWRSRSKEYRTSRAESLRPSWKVTSLRRRKRYTLSAIFRTKFRHQPGLNPSLSHIARQTLKDGRKSFPFLDENGAHRVEARDASGHGHADGAACPALL